MLLKSWRDEWNDVTGNPAAVAELLRILNRNLEPTVCSEKPTANGAIGIKVGGYDDANSGISKLHGSAKSLRLYHASGTPFPSRLRETPFAINDR